LLNVVEGVPDLIIWEQRHLGHIHVEDDEELLPLVGLDDVPDYVVRVLNVHAKHLNSFTLVLDSLDDLTVNGFLEILDPHVSRVALFVDYSRMDEFRSHQEVLMDVMEQILQVSVHTCLGVDRGLLTGDEVVELHDSYCNGLVLLSLNHQLAHLNVSYKLQTNDVVEVSRLRQVPPVLARQGSIDIVSQIIQDCAELLLVEHNVFQVQVDSCLLREGTGTR